MTAKTAPAKTAAATAAPAWGTWKTHGNAARIVLFGFDRKAPKAEGRTLDVFADGGMLAATDAATGERVSLGGPATRFWATPVAAEPADAEAKVIAKAVARRGAAKTGNPETDRKANAAKAAKAAIAAEAIANAGGSLDELRDALASAVEVAESAEVVDIEAKTEPAAKPARTPREKVAAKLPKGYAVKYENGAYDLAKKGDGAAANGAAWIVICTAHGTTTTAEKAKDGDALGRKTARGEWCANCK